MDTSRRSVAIGAAAVAVLCGTASIAANFGILSRARRDPVGRLVQPISAIERRGGNNSSYDPVGVNQPTNKGAVGSKTPQTNSNDATGSSSGDSTGDSTGNSTGNSTGASTGESTGESSAANNGNGSSQSSSPETSQQGATHTGGTRPPNTTAGTSATSPSTRGGGTVTEPTDPPEPTDPTEPTQVDPHDS